MRRNLAITLALITSSPAFAATVSAVDLATLELGPSIEGPVGITVDSGFNSGDENFGDFSGGAICPAGFSSCVPPQNPEGTIYTYVQTITPGADPVPNDAPFPNAATAVDPGNVEFYALDFWPSGFNGVAGYDFDDADAADVSFEINSSATGLTWTTADGSDWTSGETISFFFQTTQNPSGPGGVYQISNSTFTASAAGPLPTPVPLPASVLLLGAALFGLRLTKRA